MYLREVQIMNVKLLRDVRMSFLRGDKPRMWTVLVGENGLCKTTILQAVALAVSGRDRANQLANIPSLHDRRESNGVAFVNARIGFNSCVSRDRIYPRLVGNPNVPLQLNCSVWSLPLMATAMSGSQYLPEELNERPSLIGSNALEQAHSVINDLLNDPLTEVRTKNLGNWFAVGYGVNRNLLEPFSAPKMTDPAFQRMAPLFNKGPIMGTGFADLFDTKDQVRAFAKQLRKALLDNEHLLPKIKGLELRGRGGTSTAKDLILGDRFRFETGKTSVKIPATWLSQGYQATIAWIADLIGQMFWDAGKAVPLEEMEGLVLIDEIDIHLHPTWQVNLIQALKTTFPRVQFVVTTHSPMVLPGLERDEILRVRQDESGSVVVEPVDESPALMTGSELYESFFGIEALYPRDLGDALRRYGYLTSDPYRSDEEQAEMERVAAKLRAANLLPDWEPVARETA